jgi:hypothetical protein
LREACDTWEEKRIRLLITNLLTELPTTASLHKVSAATGR